MKRLLVILTFVISGCNNELYVPLSDVKTKNESDFVILGLNELKVVVSDVKFNPAKSIYIVKGYTDLLSSSNNKYS